MSPSSDAQACCDALIKLAERFPDDSRWQDLAATARRVAGHQSSVTADTRPPVPMRAVDRGACACCGVDVGAPEHGLCEHCARLYVPKTARMITDTCDCGHGPQGPLVFIFAAGSQCRTFCGTKCARLHWQETFGFFARRSSCHR